MLYLTVQMLALLLIALAIGAGIGWLLRGARDAAANEARSDADAARIADLRRDRDAAEAALAEAKAAASAADDRDVAEKSAEMQSALDACRAEVSALEAERDAAKAALAAAVTKAPSETAGASPQNAPPETVGAMSAPAHAPASSSTEPDDLKLISGIGPKLEGVLHEAGISRFEQIASLTPLQIAELDDILNFKGRIERDDWIGQAKRLAASDKS